MRKILKDFFVGGILLLILWLIFVTPLSVFCKYSLKNFGDNDDDDDDEAFDDYYSFDLDV